MEEEKEKLSLANLKAGWGELLTNEKLQGLVKGIG